MRSGAILPIVEVVWANLDLGAALLDRWHEMLNAAERARAELLRSERERRRYTTRRGILRALLARRLGRSPSELCFRANGYGKPSLIDDVDIEFNLSHARGMVLIAMSRDLTVGCDVAFRDPRFPVEDIAARFFSPREHHELLSTPRADRVAAFFAGWTRKEAFVKARGLGLSLPLDSFAVSLAADNRPALYDGCDGWSARCVAPAPGFSAAIVAEGRDWQLAASALEPRKLLGDIDARA